MARQSLLPPARGCTPHLMEILSTIVEYLCTIVVVILAIPLAIGSIIGMGMMIKGFAWDIWREKGLETVEPDPRPVPFSRAENDRILDDIEVASEKLMEAREWKDELQYDPLEKEDVGELSEAEREKWERFLELYQQIDRASPARKSPIRIAL